MPKALTRPERQALFIHEQLKSPKQKLSVNQIWHDPIDESLLSFCFTKSNTQKSRHQAWYWERGSDVEVLPLTCKPQTLNLQTVGYLLLHRNGAHEVQKGTSLQFATIQTKNNSNLPFSAEEVQKGSFCFRILNPKNSFQLNSFFSFLFFPLNVLFKKRAIKSILTSYTFAYNKKYENVVRLSNIQINTLSHAYCCDMHQVISVSSFVT